MEASPPGEPHGWIGRVARIGVLPTDSDDETLRKEMLVLFTGFTALVSFVWVGTYLTLGLYLSAAIPFAYQLVCLANLVVFARTKRYRFFRASALAMGLVLPFLLHVSLGGFLPSSGIVAWCFTAPLGGLLFASRRDATRWFGAFLGVLGLALLLEPFLTPVEIPHATVIAFLALNILGVTATSYLLLLYFGRERDRAAALAETERERSERLLLNVLPKAIAERLKAGESPIADRASDVGVLFADIVDFTPMSETMRPEEVVEVLDKVFTAFDGLVASHGLEKIKTVGDAYMVASGLLGGGERHAEDLAEAALEMRAAIAARPPLELRIGIDIGPVVAGVIGHRKFIYDLWGDTVNTAARMESHGVAGAIQVTERAYRRLSPAFAFQERGEIDVKGKGPMRTYLLVTSQVAKTRSLTQ